MRVLVTRAADDAARLSEPLRAAGFEPVEVPLLEKRVVPGAVAACEGDFDWLVLTSPAAVAAVDEALDEGWSPPPRLAAVGPRTAELAEGLGLSVDLVPEDHTGAALAEALGDLPGRRILYPRTDHTVPKTVERLRGAMAEVVDVVAYRNVEPPGAAEALTAAWPVDLATATSGSSARRLARALERAGLPPCPVVAIGPSTAAAAREAGLRVVAVADPHTVAGLIEAVRDAAVQPEGP